MLAAQWSPWCWWATATAPSPCRGAGSGAAPPLPIAGSSRYPHHPLAPGRRPLWTGGARPDGPERSASAERPTPAAAEITHRPIPVCPGPPPRWTGATAPPARLNSPACRGVVSRGRPPAPLRRVLVRDPHGGYATQALLCTDPATGPYPDPGMVCPALATGAHPSVGAGSPGVSRPKASERTEPLPVQRQPSWGSSPGSPWRLTCWGNSDPRPIAQRLVRQAVADLRGCRGPGAPPPVAGVGGFSPSAADTDIRRVPVALYHRLMDALAHAV